MSTWRQHNFREGRRYRVKREINTATSRFSPGEVLVFSGTSHSPYDSSSAFIFHCESSQEVKTWFLHDDQEDRSAELFEAVL